MSTLEGAVTSGRLPIKESGRTVFVPLDEVEYFEASGNYVRVHAGEAHYRVREKLSTMETGCRSVTLSAYIVQSL